jgi:dienelactone hydrolase
MKVSLCVIATILLGRLSETCVADPAHWQQEFYPANGKGRVVVVVTGQTGPPNYAYYAKDIAAQGYYAVLVNRLKRKKQLTVWCPAAQPVSAWAEAWARIEEQNKN